MLRWKALLAVSLLCVSVLVWAMAHAQPTLPKDNLPEDLPDQVRRLVELLYSEEPSDRIRGLDELTELKPGQFEPILPHLLSMMGDTGRVEHWLDPIPESFVIHVGGSLAVMLAKIGEPAREPLIKALADERVEVRLCAVKALGYMKDRKAAQPLAALADDAESSVRNAVSNALGLVAHPETADTLAGLLADEDQAVRTTAAKALMKLGEPGIERLVRSAKEQGVGMLEAFEVLATAREPKAVEPLIAALKSEDVELRVIGAKHLGAFEGAEVSKALAAMLADRDRKVRATAARSLGWVGDASAVEDLIAALKDKDPGLRAQAAIALGLIGDHRAVDPLIAAIGDDESRVGSAAAQALGRLKDPRAVEPLIESLSKGNSGVQAYAAEALGKINDPRAVEPLINALQDEHSGARMAAVTALGLIKDRRAVEPIVALLAEMNGKFARETAAGHARVFLQHHEYASFDPPELNVLEELITALGNLGDPLAVKPLLQTINYADCVEEVVAALKQMNIDGEIDTLLSALNADDDRLRVCAARVLGSTHDARAIAALIAVLGDRHSSLRGAAARSLQAIGQPAVEPLIQSLKKGTLPARREAAHILGSLKSTPAVPMLISALREDDPNLKREAAYALKLIAREQSGLKQDFGLDADKWQAWWDEQQDAPPKEDEPPSAQ